MFKRSGWRIYNEQMSRLDHGYALWEPAPIHSFKRIQLGDVGYVRRGRFHLLFSAGCPLGERILGTDVPATFKSLNVGPTIYSQPRVPGYLCTSTVREVGAGLGASVCAVPVLEPGVNFSFELTEKQGAALVTKYPTYREDVELESVFKAYTKRHYDSWVAFARDAGHGDDIKPVLVTGVDMTRDFAMMAYSNDSASLTSEFTTAVPMVGSASASVWGTWRTEGLVHTNCGPQLCSTPSLTQSTSLTLSDSSGTDTLLDEYNQCVFVRYYTMRKRAGVFPTVIRASAGPHDLGPGSRDDEELPEVEAQSDSDSDSDSDIATSLWDQDGDDDRSSVTSIDSESDIVVQNTTSDEEDDFDLVADYIFQNSNAESVLIHHGDIAQLRQLGGSTDIPTLLLEKRPPITVDDSGVGAIVCQAYPSRDTTSDATCSPLDTFLSSYAPCDYEPVCSLYSESDHLYSESDHLYPESDLLILRNVPNLQGEELHPQDQPQVSLQLQLGTSTAHRNSKHHYLSCKPDRTRPYRQRFAVKNDTEADLLKGIEGWAHEVAEESDACPGPAHQNKEALVLGFPSSPRLAAVPSPLPLPELLPQGMDMDNPHACPSLPNSCVSDIAPPGTDPSLVDFREFYPYIPNEIKRRKRTTQAQLEVLERTFVHDKKPNSVMRGNLARQLDMTDMTPRSIQVWFQNRRARGKSLAKKAAAIQQPQSPPTDSPDSQEGTGVNEERAWIDSEGAAPELDSGLTRRGPKPISYARIPSTSRAFLDRISLQLARARRVSCISKNDSDWEIQDQESSMSGYVRPAVSRTPSSVSGTERMLATHVSIPRLDAPAIHQMGTTDTMRTGSIAGIESVYEVYKGERYTGRQTKESRGDKRSSSIDTPGFDDTDDPGVSEAWCDELQDSTAEESLFSQLAEAAGTSPQKETSQPQRVQTEESHQHIYKSTPYRDSSSDNRFIYTPRFEEREGFTDL